MTVAELITALQGFDPNLPVVVGGLDNWGYQAAQPPTTVYVRRADTAICADWIDSPDGIPMVNLDVGY